MSVAVVWLYLFFWPTQAVNNFKKERSCSKGQINTCVTSQSQNTTSKPNPVPIATPSSVQNKIKKPLQSPCTEQVNFVLWKDALSLYLAHLQSYNHLLNTKHWFSEGFGIQLILLVIFYLQESPENKPKLEKSPPSSQSIDCSPTIPESSPFETSSEKPSSQTEQSQAMITNRYVA